MVVDYAFTRNGMVSFENIKVVQRFKKNLPRERLVVGYGRPHDKENIGTYLITLMEVDR